LRFATEGNASAGRPGSLRRFTPPPPNARVQRQALARSQSPQRRSSERRCSASHARPSRGRESGRWRQRVLAGQVELGRELAARVVGPRSPQSIPAPRPVGRRAPSHRRDTPREMHACRAKRVRRGWLRDTRRTTEAGVRCGIDAAVVRQLVGSPVRRGEVFGVGGRHQKIVAAARRSTMRGCGGPF